MDANYDVRASIINQRKYCEEHKLPHFAPFDGVCYHCHNNIYVARKYRDPFTCKDTYSGITTEEAGSKLISGCPHCDYSFCE